MEIMQTPRLRTQPFETFKHRVTFWFWYNGPQMCNVTIRSVANLENQLAQEHLHQIDPNSVIGKQESPPA